jgi:mannose-1-phosphate guanylyltransferase
MRKIGKKKIFAAILAGGRGERLWPKSRSKSPKQNLKILSRKTIMQGACERAKRIASKNVLIVANRESIAGTKKEIKKLKTGNVIVEPFGRNTAPAIALATLLAHRREKESILVAMPSDHLIADIGKFSGAVNAAAAEAERTKAVITLGIRPSSAESAYGYIGMDRKPSGTSKKSYKVTQFIEKPNRAKAKRLISSGRFYWNSGIFIFKTSVMLPLIKKYMPSFYRDLIGLPDLRQKKRFYRELKKLYLKIKGQSLDYAVMEKSRNIRVMPVYFRWSDIGSFNSIARLVKKDAYGNTVLGKHVGIDTDNCVIFSDSTNLIGTIGIRDLVVVADRNAVVVCEKNRAEDIKKLVKRIREKRLLEYL